MRYPILLACGLFCSLIFGQSDQNWPIVTDSEIVFTDHTNYSDEFVFLLPQWLALEKMSLPPTRNRLARHHTYHRNLWGNAMISWTENASGFRDPELQYPLTDREKENILFLFDHEISLQPVHYNSWIRIPLRLLQSGLIRQSIAWDEAKDNFIYWPTSFCPAAYKSHFYAIDSLAWYPVHQVSDATELHRENNIDYIVTTGHLVKVAGKEDTLDLRKCYERAINNERLLLYDVTDQSILPAAARAGLLTPRIDTIMIFDPITYEQEPTIVRQEIDWRDITHVRFNVRWFWDFKNYRLSYEYIGWTMMASQKNDFNDEITYVPIAHVVERM